MRVITDPPALAHAPPLAQASDAARAASSAAAPADPGAAGSAAAAAAAFRAASTFALALAFAFAFFSTSATTAAASSDGAAFSPPVSDVVVPSSASDAVAEAAVLALEVLALEVLAFKVEVVDSQVSPARLLASLNFPAAPEVPSRAVLPGKHCSPCHRMLFNSREKTRVQYAMDGVIPVMPYRAAAYPLRARSAAPLPSASAPAAASPG